MTSAADRRRIRLARLELGNAIGALAKVLEKLTLAEMYLNQANDARDLDD